jgi:hypothetical protein
MEKSRSNISLLCNVILVTRMPIWTLHVTRMQFQLHSLHWDHAKETLISLQHTHKHLLYELRFMYVPSLEKNTRLENETSNSHLLADNML